MTVCVSEQSSKKRKHDKKKIVIIITKTDRHIIIIKYVCNVPQIPTTHNKRQQRQHQQKTSQPEPPNPAEVPAASHTRVDLPCVCCEHHPMKPHTNKYQTAPPPTKTTHQPQQRSSLESVYDVINATVRCIVCRVRAWISTHPHTSHTNTQAQPPCDDHTWRGHTRQTLLHWPGVWHKYISANLQPRIAARV